MRAGCLLSGKQKAVVPFAALCPEKDFILEKGGEEEGGEEEVVQHYLSPSFP